MANLETNLSILREQTGTPAAAFSTLADSPEAEEILQMSLSSPRAGGLSTTLEEGLARANTFPEQIRATFLNGAADPAKLYNFLLANSTFGIFESDYDTESRRGIIPAGGLTLGRTFGPGYNQIGERSLDWRLAMPALSKALSLHLLSSTSRHSSLLHSPLRPSSRNLRIFSVSLRRRFTASPALTDLFDITQLSSSHVAPTSESLTNFILNSNTSDKTSWTSIPPLKYVLSLSSYFPAELAM